MENSVILVFLFGLSFINLIALVLLIINIRSKDGGGQNSKTIVQDMVNYMMNINAKTENKISQTKEEILREMYEHKAVLKEGNSDTQIKLVDNLSNLQERITNIISASLSSLQKNNSEELSRIHSTTQSNFELINSTNNKKLGDIQQEIERRLNDNLNQNLKSFEEVSTKLGAINKSAENMISSTASIDRLNDIFAKGSVKSYGTFSEEYLQNLLEQHIPSLWQRQASIPNSAEKIDFCINFKDVKIGIDSKFPLDSFENYTGASPEQKPTMLKLYLRSIREMATSINSKYGKHFDHLLVYLPSDSMYNEVAHDRPTLDLLNQLKIVPISPTTILTVIYAISILRTKLIINEDAKQMQDNVAKIEKGLMAFKEQFRMLGDKLRGAQEKYEAVDKHVTTIERQVGNVKGLEIEETKRYEPTQEILTIGV